MPFVFSGVSGREMCVCVRGFSSGRDRGPEAADHPFVAVGSLTGRLPSTVGVSVVVCFQWMRPGLVSAHLFFAADCAAAAGVSREPASVSGGSESVSSPSGLRRACFLPLILPSRSMHQHGAVEKRCLFRIRTCAWPGPETKCSSGSDRQRAVPHPCDSSGPSRLCLLRSRRSSTSDGRASRRRVT